MRARPTSLEAERVLDPPRRDLQAPTRVELLDSLESRRPPPSLNHALLVRRSLHAAPGSMKMSGSCALARGRLWRTSFGARTRSPHDWRGLPETQCRETRRPRAAPASLALNSMTPTTRSTRR